MGLRVDFYGKRKLQCALPLLVCYAVLYNRNFLYYGRLLHMNGPKASLLCLCGRQGR